MSDTFELPSRLREGPGVGPVIHLRGACRSRAPTPSPSRTREGNPYPPRLIVSRAMMSCWIWLVPS